MPKTPRVPNETATASKLDGLPASNDKYWEHADTNQHTLKENSHEHYFDYYKGSEVKCSCGVGYFLSPGWEVKKGHIYQHGSLVF